MVKLKLLDEQIDDKNFGFFLRKCQISCQLDLEVAPVETHFLLNFNFILDQKFQQFLPC